MADKKKTSSDRWDRDLMFGPSANYAASEAYKLLRANVTYSFSSESTCHIIGIVSSVRSEGKSTTACNLAYAMMEAGKRTLLVEGDLRLPSLSAKLDLKIGPGLTDLLVMNEKLGNVLQQCKLAPKLDIITAGSPTPNPSELLASNVMKAVMKELSKYYEYIIVDLPPITAVSDALSISKLLDGVIMVVRSNHVTRKELAEAMRQLKLVNVRILGFAYRGMSENERSKKYREYKKQYYHGYDNRVRKERK